MLYPNTVRYESNKSLKYFVNRSGGFDTRAQKSRTYVVYASGSVARTKSFLFLKFYPNAEPGSEIIVPSKPVKIPLKSTDLLAMATSLATIAALVIAATR